MSEIKAETIKKDRKQSTITVERINKTMCHGTTVRAVASNNTSANHTTPNGKLPRPQCAYTAWSSVRKYKPVCSAKVSHRVKLKHTGQGTTREETQQGRKQGAREHISSGTIP